MNQNQQPSSAAAAVEVATVRSSLRSEIYQVSDSVHKSAQDLKSKEFDEVAEFTLAQFLYTVIPVWLLQQYGLVDLTEALAVKHGIKNRFEVERG